MKTLIKPLALAALLSVSHHASAASLVMDSAFAKAHAAPLKHALATKQPEFAGRYIVANWDCGAICITGAIIDAHTGQAYPWPVRIKTVSGRHRDGLLEYRYRSNSNMISFAGHLEGVIKNRHANNTRAFYEFRNGQFHLVRKAPYHR